MQHPREKYQETIIDLRTALKEPGYIPEDEPVFILRGQDKCAPEVVRAWARLNVASGGSEELSNQALDWADRMVRWQDETGKRKLAD